MFTGIVEQLGRVAARSGSAAGARLEVELGTCRDGVRLGDSIAIDGVCLTATALGDTTAGFDVGPESLERSSLGKLVVGDEVHLERALRADGRFDGHLVQGHVDCVGTLVTSTARGQAVDLTIALPGARQPLAVEKGSIAVAGVSLTINSVQGNRFTVSLVPFSQERTWLARARVGRALNIEYDIVGRYVASLLAGGAGGGGLSLNFLKEHGFA